MNAGEQGYSATPTPHEIIRAMEKAPPLGREQVTADVLGRAVRWELRYFGALIELEQKPFEADVQATMRYSWSRLSISVFTFLDTRQYPELKTALRGQRMVLYGTIVEADDFNIRLKTDRMELLPFRFFDPWTNL